MDYEKSTSDILFIEIRACERRLDSVNSRIKKLTKKKSPVRNLKLILPFVTSFFFLIFPRLACDYCIKTVKEANARGIYLDIDLGIFNNHHIMWLLVDLPRLLSITLILIIIAVYCFIRLFGRYGYTKSGILPSKIARFFGDINYNNELNASYKEYSLLREELDNLIERKVDVELQQKA